ncbi:YggS family pyridoxal phosphate-dependent enzyme [Herbaspirillum robiniae]|uniref:Pyridoxal phosphate homeostasis protein n=1 Tax=Herbaspirillum robiniae TaxID=2014887 RepID=A0ABX2M3S0_9BURK|nr:YggS family pyridoxal phosphate-dependent enzyme [Herbaspirillum robiniae]NUU04383.1 YggS family pyridoxal phosphate-dependent enzyme [Herbaspirillum robiniae]
MSSITKNLQHVQHQIAASAERARRAPSSIQLLAVSKTFGEDAVREAVQAGQFAFGENYLQEALEKIAALKSPAPAARLEWHFIGPIQSNKTRPIAEQFDWVHSVDREKIARRLSEQRPAELGPLNVCLQVNISGEASKSGLTPQELPEVAAQVAQLPHIRLRGLMAIPEPTEDVARQHQAFAAVRALYESLRAGGLALDTLSMGMSADLEAAVAEGATIVRIGSAIFGARNYT